MSEPSQVLSEVADFVRAKNAGPFWTTLDVFLLTDEAYARVAADSVINADSIVQLYEVDPGNVRIFRQNPRQVVIVDTRPRVHRAASSAGIAAFLMGSRAVLTRNVRTYLNRTAGLDRGRFRPCGRGGEA